MRALQIVLHDAKTKDTKVPFDIRAPLNKWDEWGK
jgi:hypothetical protein